jgi:hypothetical protein
MGEIMILWPFKIIGGGILICIGIFIVCWIVHVLLVLTMQWNALKA